MFHTENHAGGLSRKTLARLRNLFRQRPINGFFAPTVKRIYTVLNYKNSVSFQRGESPAVLLRNFYEPEDGFVWSTSKWSEIIFSFSEGTPQKAKTSDLILDLDVFKSPPSLPHQTVKFYLNGWRIGSRDVDGRTTTLIPFNSTLLNPVENVLTFDTPDASIPARFNVPDERRLGVQLFSMQFRPGG
jgi:hypothetical protein